MAESESEQNGTDYERLLDMGDVKRVIELSITILCLSFARETPQRRISPKDLRTIIDDKEAVK